MLTRETLVRLEPDLNQYVSAGRIHWIWRQADRHPVHSHTLSRRGCTQPRVCLHSPPGSECSVPPASVLLSNGLGSRWHLRHGWPRCLRGITPLGKCFTSWNDWGAEICQRKRRRSTTLMSTVALFRDRLKRSQIALIDWNGKMASVMSRSMWSCSGGLAMCMAMPLSGRRQTLWGRAKPNAMGMQARAESGRSRMSTRATQWQVSLSPYHIGWGAKTINCACNQLCYFLCCLEYLDSQQSFNPLQWY